MLLLQITLLKDSTVCTSKQLNETQKEALNQVLAQFSSTCKRYTDVMALKYLLQCHVFSSQLPLNKTSELANLIINLQRAAKRLQEMEVGYFNSIVSTLMCFKSMQRAIFTNSSCIEFSASQYQYIYTSTGFDELKDRPKIWKNNIGTCCTWNKSYENIYSISSQP